MSERIENLISKEALAQFDQLNQKVDANVSSFEKLVAKAIDLNKQLGAATGFKDMTKAANDLAKTEADLTKAQNDLLVAQERLKKAQDDELKKLTELEKQRAKLNNLYTDEAQKIAELKVQQQEQNKALKEQAQETLGLTDAYKKLEKEYTVAAKEAKNLAVQFGAGSKEAKEASARALELDARLKAADANVGRFNRNVGNYSGALNTLRSALQEVSKRIDENTKSGNQNEDVVKALVQEQALLERLVNSQAAGFASVTAEVKANVIALQQLAAAGLDGSEAYKQLFKQTSALKDEADDLKQALKNAVPDDAVFRGATEAAKGLVGIYGLAQSASAIFGEENEALQKSMVKLQAAETALQSIEALYNLTKKEGAFQSLKNIALQKVEIVQTSLSTAAESRNIIVKYAAIAAQKALNVATSAAGGPILILIGLLALAASSFAAYGDGAENAAKQNERLNKSLDRSNQNIEKGAAAIQARSDKTIATLEDNFAKEEDIRKERERSAQEEIDNLKRINDADLRNRIANQKTIDRLNKEKAKSGLDEDEQKELDEALKIKDSYLANLQKQTDAENGIEILRLQNSRATKEEIIKAKQDEIETQKTQLQTQIQLQQSIAGNERKTQQERVNALKESAKLQSQIINKDANSKLLNPTLTPSEIKAIEATRTAALTQARRESNKAIEDLNRSYAERERKARFDILKLEIEDQIKAADLVANNEAKSFNDRTDALYVGYQKRRDIIIAQREFDIKNDTLTAEERLAIEQKFLSDINGLTVDYGLQQQALYADNQDKINEIIAKGQQARQDKIAGDAATASTELVKQLAAGQITLEEYSRQREQLEHSARIQSLKEEVNNATAKVLTTKEGTAARFEAEKELREKTLALNEEYNKKEIDAITKLNDLKKELASESVQTFTALINGQFDNESARIQQQMDELDKQKEKEIEVANATIANKEQKELAIATIEKKAQVQREQLEKRQRQIDLDRARFEKASNIAQIISSTALAIIEALKTYKGTPQAFAVAAAIGTIGALQLARAIAAPLPKFAEGTDDAPGGLAWVGDAYRKELVITPQGRVMETPSVPTVMNVPKHSIVLPDARAALEGGLAVNQHGKLIQAENNNTLKIEQKLDNIAKAIKNKPVLNMSANERGLTAMWNYGANWVTYVEDQINF